ncbi:MAG: hypothetical protein ACC657_14670 [Thiohalomonadales bacterium]
MLKIIGKSTVLLCFFMTTIVLAEKAPAPAKSNYDIGKNIGNLVGVAYGTKLMYQEVQPLCVKLSAQSGFEQALTQWESRNQKVVKKSSDLWHKTVSTLEDLNKKAGISKQEKEQYSKMIGQFNSMIGSLKKTIATKLDASPASSKVELCNRIVSLLNSKKLDVINRDKDLYEKLLTWDLNEYQRQLVKMLHPG